MRKALIFTAIILLGGIQAHSFEWQPIDYDYRSRTQLLEQSSALFIFNYQQREITKFRNSDGEIKKLRTLVADDNSSPSRSTKENDSYDVVVREQLYVPSWLYGVNSKWTLGVSMPFIQSVTKKSYSNEFRDEEAGMIRVGNAEIISRTHGLDINRHKLIYIQKLRFPSAQEAKSNFARGLSPEPAGLGAAVGATYEYATGAKFVLFSSAMAEFNAKDQVVVKDTKDEKVVLERDPGESFEIVAGTEYYIFSSASVSFGASHKFKSRDKINTPSNYEIADDKGAQSRANIEFKYVGRNMRELESVYAAKLKYSSTISGQNMAEADVVGVQFLITY